MKADDIWMSSKDQQSGNFSRKRKHRRGRRIVHHLEGQLVPGPLPAKSEQDRRSGAGAERQICHPALFPYISSRRASQSKGDQQVARSVQASAYDEKPGTGNGFVPGGCVPSF